MNFFKPMQKKLLLEVLLNLVVMTATFLMMALAIEGGMQVCRHFSGASPDEKLYDYDAVLGWKTKPNLSIELLREGRKILMVTNSKGFRGPEIPYEKSPGTERILILGKSFAQSVQVRFEELFSERLKSDLREQFPGSVEILNTGTAGHSTDQVLLFFRSEGVRYSPDLTILMFHDNDIWFNNQDHFFDKPKPHFIESGGELVLTGTPVPKFLPQIPTAATAVKSPGFFKAIKNELESYSLFYQWIRAKVRANPVLFRLSIRLGLSGKDGAKVPDDFRAWKRHRDPDIDQAWKITEKLLLEIRRQAEAAGSRFVIFYVPSRPAIIPEHWYATRMQYGLNDRDWNVNQITEELQKFCQVNQIDLIEPTGDFIRAAKEEFKTKPLYYAMDSHWTPEGHQVAANTMSRWVLKNFMSRKATA